MNPLYDIVSRLPQSALSPPAISGWHEDYGPEYEEVVSQVLAVAEPMSKNNPVLAELLKVRGLSARFFPSERFFQPRIIRDVLVTMYAWATPTPEAIETILRYSPLIEIGAGTGYWAWVLTQAGADIVAYDWRPYSNRWCHGEYFQVRQGGPSMARRYRQRTLFLCWPPNDDPMAANALRSYRGRRLVYIGEHGGCNATTAFFNRLERDWREVEAVPLLQWEGLHDGLYIYERK